MSALNDLHAQAMRESEEYRLSYLAEVERFEKIDALRRLVLKELTLRRKKLKLTQKELADRIDTSQSFVSQIEKDKTSICLNTLIELAEAMNLEVRLVPKAMAASEAVDCEADIAAENRPIYSAWAEEK